MSTGAATPTKMRILDLGCGNRKRPGAIGIDHNPNTQADIVHSLEKFPYPFKDSEFDEIYADNVIEHLDDVVRTVEELHRISKPGGLVKVIVPYFRSMWAAIDPTHRHAFTVDSFSYFDERHPNSKLYNYSKARFKIERIVFNEQVPAWLPKRTLVKIANIWPHRYEIYLSHLVPLDGLSYYLRTEK